MPCRRDFHPYDRRQVGVGGVDADCLSRIVQKMLQIPPQKVAVAFSPKPVLALRVEGKGACGQAFGAFERFRLRIIAPLIVGWVDA